MPIAVHGEGRHVELGPTHCRAPSARNRSCIRLRFRRCQVRFDQLERNVASAGTGVWVVNTVVSCTCARAHRRSHPLEVRDAVAPRMRHALRSGSHTFERCPSREARGRHPGRARFRCTRVSGCRRIRADSSRSQGALASRAVSSSRSVIFPARTCHTACTARVPSGTETTHRSPSLESRPTGASCQSICSEPICQPSAETFW